MWFTALIPILSNFFGENGPLGQFFKTKAQKVQAQQDLDLQVEKDKMALSMQMAQNEVESEKNKLNATGQGFKFVSFCLITLPIVITCIVPEYGRRIFENLSVIPVGFMQLWAAVVGVIWGLPIAANTMTAIFSAIQSGWNLRNQGKIEKIQAIGQQENMNLDQAKKQIFDILREVNGVITQSQVAKMDPILDKVLPMLGTENAPIQTKT